MSADQIYSWVRLGLSIWAFVAALLLFVQSLPRIRQTAPTAERRVRMAAIILALLGVLVLLGFSAIYTWSQPVPTDPVLIFLAVASRMFPAVLITILVITKPSYEDSAPPSEEEMADFRAWRRLRNKREQEMSTPKPQDQAKLP